MESKSESKFQIRVQIRISGSSPSAHGQRQRSRSYAPEKCPRRPHYRVDNPPALVPTLPSSKPIRDTAKCRRRQPCMALSGWSRSGEVRRGCRWVLGVSTPKYRGVEWAGLSRGGPGRRGIPTSLPTLLHGCPHPSMIADSPPWLSTAHYGGVGGLRGLGVSAAGRHRGLKRHWRVCSSIYEASTRFVTA
jgi:hypothetical protein